MIGHVHYDRSGITNERTEILVQPKNIGNLIRNKYVKIINATDDQKEFLGRIVEGPFYLPEEVGRESALAQTAILKGEEFPSIPSYYAVGGIEILGELRNGRRFGVNTRPAPQARVYELPDDDVRLLLDISGDMLLGSLDGYDDINVKLRSDKKSVLPRNTGIFGTVGSGKSNTAQVLFEEAAKAGYAVVILDVEGEYVEMDNPTTEVPLHPLLRNFGLEPAGLEDFAVYYPSNSSSERLDAKTFTLRSCDYEPAVISEIIGTTEAQDRALIELIDEFRKKTKDDDIGKTEAATLADLLKRKSERKVPYTLSDLVDKAYEKGGHGQDQRTFRALCGKLARLRRSEAFDDPTTEPIIPSEIIVSGKVTVFDVSNCNDTVKNLVTADLLKKIFAFKISNEASCKTLLAIEEAHSFISREKARTMTETLEMLREVSRRGRKRWFGLCFISQQPSHLPEEIFELCNTRIVHNVKSLHNLQALKMTAGDVTEEMWNNCPVLGVGQAVVSSPQFKDPIVINVRPAATKRKLVE